MFDGCLYFNLSTLSRQITKIWQEEFALHGLSPSHGYLLMAMGSNTQASHTELSEIMELDASTITRFIDVLVKKDMVERVGSGKGATFVCTEKGRNTVESVQQAGSNLKSKMQAKFGTKKFASVVGDLAEMKQILRE